MKTQSSFRNRGFTLLETVIAIGVLTVLLTGFMVVFAPAAAGIKKSINVQAADRLASALEQELVTSRSGEPSPGFSKAFEWIIDSGSASDALFVYQYRGDVRNSTDGVPNPYTGTGVAGTDYTMVTMVRQKSDINKLRADLAAVEGGVYFVKCTQLVFDDSKLKLETIGQIVNPTEKTLANSVQDYGDAVIAFTADFYTTPSKAESYFTSSKFTELFSRTSVRPVFSRNLAVRR